MKVSVISQERKDFHSSLLKELLVLDDQGVASNADSGNAASKEIALGIATRIAIALKSNLQTRKKLPGQSAGDIFEKLVCQFVERTFSKLSEIRPGDWAIKRISSRTSLTIADFDQYQHLASLAKIAKVNPDLAIVLGNDYTIAPDVVVVRALELDSSINRTQTLVDENSGTRATIRSSAGGSPIMHASISCKWTMRSDRAQNARSEALNLIRNRKGRTPHIAVVTGEPTPSRLSSLAIGTGDIDCVYHFALYELVEAVNDIGQSEAVAMLKNMIDGKRLKDISDLPLDLAI
jgi:hypothetical protein